jgi:glycine cleavage system regulatory protein
MIHFEVEEAQVEPLSAALRALEAAGLRVVIATSGPAARPAARRVAKLELVGHDRPGIVRELSQALAALGVNIEELETHVASAAMSGERLFKVRAELAIPETLALAALRDGLESLANEMMIDLELGERAAG